MAFMFEKLEVYQKAVDFSDHVTALTEGFPRGYGCLADQLNRAARPDAGQGCADRTRSGGAAKLGRPRPIVLTISNHLSF